MNQADLIAAAAEVDEIISTKSSPPVSIGLAINTLGRVTGTDGSMFVGDLFKAGAEWSPLVAASHQAASAEVTDDSSH